MIWERSSTDYRSTTAPKHRLNEAVPYRVFASQLHSLVKKKHMLMEKYHCWHSYTNL